MNAIFLSGGGARGAYEVGVLKSLMGAGLKIDIIGGTSVGAVNAVLAATDQIDELSDVWQKVSTLSVYRPRLDVWNLGSWLSLTDNTGLAKRLRDEVRWSRLARSPMRVFISATNLTLRQNEVFSTSEITYRHVLASSAIPLLFPPVRLGRYWYIDGAFSLLRPLKPLIKAGADRIFTVYLTPRRPRLDPPGGLFEIADRALEVIMSSAIAGDRAQIFDTNQEIDRLADAGIADEVLRHKPFRKVEVISIHPSRDLGRVGSWLVFSKERSRELIELGAADALAVLERHELI
ncbi:MAG: patatin-like phospholipase family protein [Myxococcales bacterium]|nr:patatin-like phospholipase family protein [Myxococcales bacterium]